MKLVKTAAKWIAIIVVAAMVYSRYQDAGEQVTGLLFALMAAFWAIWTLAKKLDAHAERIQALETKLWTLDQKSKIPAYEWDENIEPPKL
jgi:uncharacterized membrane protein